jgi:hypothetical protein
VRCDATCRADKTLKKAAAAIQHLWGSEWTTQVAVQQPLDDVATFSGFFGSYDWSYVDAMGAVQRGVVHFGRGRGRRAAQLPSRPGGPAGRKPGAWSEGLQQDAAFWPK